MLKDKYPEVVSRKPEKTKTKVSTAPSPPGRILFISGTVDSEVVGCLNKKITLHGDMKKVATRVNFGHHMAQDIVGCGMARACLTNVGSSTGLSLLFRQVVFLWRNGKGMFSQGGGCRKQEHVHPRRGVLEVVSGG